MPSFAGREGCSDSDNLPRSPAWTDLDGHRSEAERTNHDTYVVRAEPVGPEEVDVTVEGPQGQRRRRLHLPGSASTHEAAVTGLVAGATQAAALGARVVRVVVTDRVLDGYLRLNWRPRSLGMVAAVLRLVEALADVNAEFEYRVPERHR